MPSYMMTRGYNVFEGRTAELSMGFRSSIFLLILVFNFLPLFALWSAVRLWIASKSRQRIILVAVALFILVSNIPISAFWVRSMYDDLYALSPSTLQLMFLPALVWQTTALLFTLFVGPIYVIWLARRAAKNAIRRKPETPQPSPAATPSAAISRRAFVTGGAGL